MTPFLIAIAGGSCSGKTALARCLAEKLPEGETKILGLDSYYRDLLADEKKSPNFDIPEALDKELLFDQLQSLAKGKVIEKPVYDFVTHSRLSQKDLFVPQRFVFVEGLFVLYWEEIRELVQTKIFITLDHATCLERRITRDVEERGRMAESVTRQYNETVRPMFELYVLPTQQYADLILNGLEPIDSLAETVLNYLKKKFGQ